jgi:transposase
MPADLTRLFPLLDSVNPRPISGRGALRTTEPHRTQGEIRFEIPDEMISNSHPARLIWEVLGRQNLTKFGENYRSIEGRKGRSVVSLRMLLTLWMYAISIGVGSAREIARLTKTDIAFKWICGDLDVSHHTLSKFRVGNFKALDQLMTDILAALMHKGFLSLEIVAQDGTRTRAAAAAPSFRGYGSLLECRAQAALHLKAVLAAADDPEYTRAQHARREVAARDFQARVEDAIATVVELQQERGPSDKPPRASTTDAEARVMKMGDGGFRPAFNVQYSVAGSEFGGPRTIVALDVTNMGTDMGMLAPMTSQIEKRTGARPKAVLADGGYVHHADIIDLERRGIEVLIPPSRRAKALDQLAGYPPEIARWRFRMETPEAKKKYRARAGLCELINAHQKSHHGLSSFLVRGIQKVTCVVLLSAITSNVVQHIFHL